MDKKRQVIDTRRPNYAVFRRRRRIAFLILALLALLILGGLTSYPFSSEETSAPYERVDTPVVEEAPDAVSKEVAAEKKAAEEKAAKEAEEERLAAMAPDDPTLYLTVPRLGIYGHTVRNDSSEAALDLGAIKVPSTGFPWQKDDTNTYIACHRIGWPGTESYNQCLNLPAMQKGNEVFLEDANGTVYKYLVSDIFAVGPNDSWTTKPVAGKDVVSLQTCTETPNDWWTIGPSLFGGGPESGRLIVQAERVS